MRDGRTLGSSPEKRTRNRELRAAGQRSTHRLGSPHCCLKTKQKTNY